MRIKTKKGKHYINNGEKWELCSGLSEAWALMFEKRKIDRALGRQVSHSLNRMYPVRSLVPSGKKKIKKEVLE